MKKEVLISILSVTVLALLFYTLKFLDALPFDLRTEKVIEKIFLALFAIWLIFWAIFKKKNFKEEI